MNGYEGHEYVHTGKKVRRMQAGMWGSWEGGGGGGGGNI